MALKPVGVRLVAEDAKKFQDDVRDSLKVLTDFVEETKKASNESKKSQPKAEGLSGAFKAVSGSVGKALGPLIAVTASVAAVGVGFGLLMRKAMSATAAHEQLTISLSTLVSREMRAADSTLTMEEALELSTKRAEELSKWIDQLAIKSPFGTKSVSSAFNTAVAYGFASEEAQRLTTVMLDIATVSPKGEAAIGALSYALGQMKARGKVSAEELNQLQTAGALTTPVLEAMGFAVSDVGKKFIDANEFINTFVEINERDLQGVAGRSAETVNGLLNSVQDLSEIGLRQLFGPAIQATLPLLSAFVGRIQEIMPAVEAFGEGLGFLVSAIIDTFVPGLIEGGEEAASGWEREMDTINERTEDTTSKMFGYGSDLVLMFAEGMVAAIGAVIDALSMIGSVVAHWLAPGSPPRLLPDIDVWGTSAMNEFVKGMTKADFGMFKDISSMVEKVFRSQAGKDDKGLIPQILGTREIIAEAVTQMREVGQVGEDTYKRLFESLGDNNQSLKDYVNALLDVEQAQKRLNDITEKYQEILSPLHEELGEIAKRRKEVVDQQRKDELAAILEDENAPALARELALMELREMELKDQISATEEQMQTEAEAAASELQLSQDRLEAQKNLLDAQLENNKLIKEQISLLERLNKAGAGGGGGGGRGGRGFPKPPKGKDPTDAIGEAFQERLDKLKEKIGETLKPLQDKIRKFKEIWGENIQGIKDILTSDFAVAVAEAFGPGGTFYTGLNEAKLMLTTWVVDFLLAMHDWKLNFNEVLQLGFDAVKETILTWTIDTALNINDWREETTTTITGWIDDITEKFDTFKTNVVDGLKTGLDNLKGAFNDIKSAIINLGTAISGLDLGDLWAFIGQSPSPLEKGTRGAITALRQMNATLPNLQFPETSVPLVQNVNQSQQQNNFNMGGNNVQSAMDMAVLEAMIERTVANALS